MRGILVAMPDRNHLATFLRTRRERRSPADAGLPGGGRRRTPGLRREELATLAGISVDYLVRLEQGRETNPSSSVLAALSDALQLDVSERVHLRNLVGLISCQEPPETAVDATTLALLNRLDPTPAFVLEQTADVSFWNSAYEGLMAATGLLDLERPNLLRYTFLVPAARSFFRDWEAIAAEQVGNLRTVTGWASNDPALTTLVGELSVKSPDFARLWASHDVGDGRPARQHLNHPLAGELIVDVEALLIPGCNQRQLVTYLPVGEANARALDRIVAAAHSPASSPGHERPSGHLRLVADSH